jgi:hypothetical protein
VGWQEELVSELHRAVNGEKDLVMKKYETMTGKTPRALYRIAKRHGYESGRKERNDKGLSAINKDQATYVASLMEITKREIKGQIMPVNVALDIAEERGIIERGVVSANRMRAILRHYGMDKKTVSTPQPRIMMRSLYPNHVHVFDASICIQYYLKDGKGLGIMDERKFYKNKPQNYKATKEHIIRYILVDHYSHEIYVKYYVAAGENKETVFDFLLSSWGPKNADKYPFRGTPEFMLMDAGSANICKPMKHFIDGMGIRTPENMPHNPSRQGSAEVAQNIVETHFECKLGIQPAYSIEELNIWALDWATWYNATQKHSRHGLTRTQCWLKITKEQLRELPERDLLTALFATPSDSRKITPQYTISYKPAGKNYGAKIYSLRHLPDIAPGRNVTIMLRPLIWPEIGVLWKEIEYAIKPLDIENAGFAQEAAIIGQEYKGVSESPAQRFKKEALNLAYGEAGKKDQSAFPGSPIMGNMAERITHDFIPRKGIPHQITKKDMLAREIPVIEAIRRLSTKIGPVSMVMNQQIRSAYGTSIPENEAARIISEIKETGTFSMPLIAEAGGNAC